jgi:hypothetical protein
VTLNVCVSCETAASYCSRLRSLDRRDPCWYDRPSTGPLVRSEKAALVSGSSSRDRLRVSVLSLAEA